MMTDPAAVKIMAKMTSLGEHATGPAVAALAQRLAEIKNKYEEAEYPKVNPSAGSTDINYGDSEEIVKGSSGKHPTKITITPKKPLGKNLGTIRGMIKSESGGDINAKNPKSSASGVLQYTDQTWKDAVKKYPELGLSVKDKNKPKAQLALTNHIIDNEYKPALAKANIKPTPGAIYAMHHFGQGNAIKFLTQPKGFKYAYKVFPKQVVKDNINVFFDENHKPRTNKMLYTWLNKRVSP
jgi:hypothetical protein